METDDEVEIPLHAFINLALDGAAPSGGEGFVTLPGTDVSQM
jgi:hypothetical protein